MPLVSWELTRSMPHLEADRWGFEVVGVATSSVAVDVPMLAEGSSVTQNADKAALVGRAVFVARTARTDSLGARVIAIGQTFVEGAARRVGRAAVDRAGTQVGTIPNLAGRVRLAA
jgi:hypothetical protein